MDATKLPGPQIDEALLPFQYFVEELADIGQQLVDEEWGVQMKMEKASINMPIELDVLVGEDGQVILGASPPTSKVETSFMPMFHQMKITIEIND